MTKLLKNFILISALFAIFTGCNKEDDLQEIFTGRNWTLAYIQEGTEKIMPQEGNYAILFEDATFVLTTPNDVRISGKWQADGENRKFSCTQITTTGDITEDKIAQKMEVLLQSTISYEGDANWLQLITQPGNVFIQFHNR